MRAFVASLMVGALALTVVDVFQTGLGWTKALLIAAFVALLAVLAFIALREEDDAP